ncbi:hypothetical protein FS837_012547 [Tulasnella sp. UAMH 9824]|nr:hypothetical protein FS837_012547 [Tulasnella sp. UAMH 9824]
MVTRQTNLRGLVRHGKSNTFELRGVEARHFSLFLAALRAARDFNFSLEDLKTILTLASDWGFPRIQNRSMTALQNLRLPPVDKLLLAKRCQIAEWIREAYLALALRTPGLETADAPALGATATSVITHAREEILLHRMQALTLVDSSTLDSQCESPSQACREALCDIRLALLAKKTKVPKRDDAQARILLKEVSKLGLELCDTCRSDVAIACTIRALDEEISIAKRVFEDDIGRENSKWIQNA